MKIASLDRRPIGIRAVKAALPYVKPLKNHKETRYPWNNPGFWDRPPLARTPQQEIKYETD